MERPIACNVTGCDLFSEVDLKPPIIRRTRGVEPVTPPQGWPELHWAYQYLMTEHHPPHHKL